MSVIIIIAAYLLGFLMAMGGFGYVHTRETRKIREAAQADVQEAVDSRPHWEVKIDSPDLEEGPLVNTDTRALYIIWRFGERTNDGYIDLLQDYAGRLHVWVKPEGWTEPNGKIDALAGTGSDPKGWRR